ncbi:hypothetical protein [Tsukamurella sp. PLM1]|uniref:hypothetical protein n=1 Tax=Tsukamurella sp. PLM1 TaxID=2929795 RepID=UPI00204A9496|nr:hypothetical protein [Tsukamurella sp. PLM1]BDH55202.1 hypothetical protein MTP03_01410 [Tsukamurella sp. PLM1]
MNSRTASRPATALDDIVDDPVFGEYHHGVADAPIDAVWNALTTTTWADLRLLRTLWRIRSPLSTPNAGLPFMETLSSHAVTVADPPRTLLFALVGRPWSPVAPHVAECHTVDEIRAFDEPGWLVYGMEWRLTALDERRTLLETRTHCRPTSTAARIAFTLYWTAIRAGSGLIRRDMIATVARRSVARPGS